MMKCSTPILYQFIHLGNNSKVDMLNINLVIQKEEWLVKKFKEFEDQQVKIPNELIGKILTKAKVC